MAGIGAEFHLAVVAKVLAVPRAGFADFGAHCARPAMQGRMAQHEVRAGLADFHAVQHQANMRRIRMRAALHQTVLDRFQASVVTLLTKPDTLLHRIVHG